MIARDYHSAPTEHLTYILSWKRTWNEIDLLNDKAADVDFLKHMALSNLK